MARVIYGTANLSDSATAIQLSGDSVGRVMVFSIHARRGNDGTIYIGSDSAVSSASGWELAANEDDTRRYQDFAEAPMIAPEAHWMNATSTTQKADWWMLVEN